MAEKLEFKNITMEFPGVRALDSMCFSALAGRVTAVLGENGAGKSTLLKILFGDYIATKGETLIDDEVMHFSSPHDAIKKGLSIIYQERQLVSNLTIADNIHLGLMPEKVGFVRKQEMYAETQRIIDEFGMPLSPETKVGRLSTAHQQMVEIMKAYRRKSDIIAFDEPSASLTNREIDKLFEIIRKLKDQGKIVLYVSHRLKEIFEICDDVVVLKDGKLVKTLEAKDTDENELVRLMVGRDLGDVFKDITHKPNHESVLLEVKGLTNHSVRNISFSLKKGEILGFSGLVGAGRSELIESIFGVTKYTDGEILFEGKSVRIQNCKDAIKLGIGLCPEDRKLQGIIPFCSLHVNIVVTLQKEFAKLGFFINLPLEKKTSLKIVDRLAIKTSSIEKTIFFLSGGNQQKAILGRWITKPLKLLILDEPTKGIDVGAKAEIYKLIYELAQSGISVIVISSELPEIIGLCDRILVMKDGAITGEVDSADATEERLLSYAILDK